MAKYVVRWDPKNGACYPEGLVQDKVAEFVANGGEWVIGQPILVTMLQHRVFKGTISPDEITFIGDDGEVYPIDKDGMFSKIYPNTYHDLLQVTLLAMF